MSTKKLLGGISVGFAALMLFAGMAAAQDATAEQPKQTLNKEVGNWTVKCFEKSGVTRCNMIEVLVNKKTGERVLAVSVQYAPTQKRSVIEVSVPLHVALQKGAVINADTYTSGTLKYKICDQMGCYIVLPADDSVIASLGKATQASIEIVDFVSGKKVPLKIPLDGFSSAYQAVVEASHG